MGGIGEIARGFDAAAVSFEQMLKISKIYEEGAAKASTASSHIDRQIIEAQTKQQAQMAFALLAAQKAVEAINYIGNTLKSQKEKQKDYYNTVINQQHQYNLLLNDEIRLRSQANSLYKAPIGSIIKDSLSAGANAAKELNSSLEALSEGKAKDGVKTATNGLKLIKSLIFNPVGVFDSVETVDKLVPLLEKYDKLIEIDPSTGTKKLNVELAKTLISTKAVDDATAEYLQRAIEWTEKYNEAQKQLNDSIIALTGEIGENLTNALVNAFRAGETAAKALGDTVAEVIENIVIDAIKLQYIKPIVDRLTADIKASYAPGGDGEITDDLQRFKEYGLKPMQDGFNTIEKAQQDILKTMGIDIFKPTNGSSASGLSGRIEGVSQESVSVAIGQMNAIRIDLAQQNDMMRNQLLHLSKISANSDFLPYLKSIDDRLKKIEGKSDDLRSGGL